MLNINKIGQKISSLRKAHNLTQAALAEKLFVSFQAVSSWERGLTMPDVDKLKDLSDIFDCSIEDIIGEDGKTVEKVIAGNAPPLEDVSQIAPMIEPNKLDELVKTAVESDGKKSKLDMKLLASFAPFIGSTLLGELLQEAGEVDVKEYAALLPFLDDEYLSALADKLIIDNAEQLVMLAPFLDKDKLIALIDKLVVDDPNHVIALAPFLDKESLASLADKLCGLDRDYIIALAPFLGSDYLVDRIRNADKKA